MHVIVLQWSQLIPKPKPMYKTFTRQQTRWHTTSRSEAGEGHSVPTHAQPGRHLCYYFIDGGSAGTKGAFHGQVRPSHTYGTKHINNANRNNPHSKTLLIIWALAGVAVCNRTQWLYTGPSLGCAQSERPAKDNELNKNLNDNDNFTYLLSRGHVQSARSPTRAGNARSTGNDKS